MNSNKNLLFTLLCLVAFNYTNAQETDTDENKLSLTEGTIDNQFEYVIQRSNNYEDYKVVKKTWLYALKAHTIDTLKVIQQNLSDTKLVVKNQAEEIKILKDNLANTNATLSTVKEEKNNMSLFGMQMSKAGYSALMWSFIAILLALLLLFIYKFRNSNIITKQAKKSLEDTEREFDEHRSIALEREQKVRRQLQDEINKQKTNKKDK
ncbi:tRNA (guanine-N1)-methyltransferase [Aquaticitalea lipolytica]|uniref:tRNA (guanine-N1)-methyltransferase n=1 Tax=Aquaticitalea lipolytica TaxID=1247562 RepID=UPI0024B88A5F|nr:tRNA (guanine-N1)-methyltransferase [Aquaticitalea lipolytica]